jgi:surfactin synthase thioesterase subunit
MRSVTEHAVGMGRARWLSHYEGNGTGATLVFPHAGGSAAGYRELAQALTVAGDVYVMQYPRRGDRQHEPAPLTVPALARDLFEAAPWAQLGQLRLFGHSMGAVVAYEFGCVAERLGVPVQVLWASAGPPPSVVAEMEALPTTDAEILADLETLGGTESRLLRDEEFVALLLPAVRGDYDAINRYTYHPEVRLTADIHALGGVDDTRVDLAQLGRWEEHTDGVYSLTQFPGGHFYIDQHYDDVARLVATRDVSQ